MANVLAFFLALKVLGLCRALPVCPEVTCPCSTYKLDDDGCQVCDCSPVNRTTPTPSPSEHCPMTVTCLCPDQILDSNGCPVCDCPQVTTTTTTTLNPTTPPTPKPVTCFEVTCRCSNYKYDSNGCRDCDCPDIITTTTTTPNPNVTCKPIFCPCSVYKYDSNGCNYCDCTTTVTPTKTTTTYPHECPFPWDCFCWKFITDSHGCVVCDCNSTSNTTTTTTTPPITTTAPNATTTKFECPYALSCPCAGYKMDNRGCPVCDCPTSTTTPKTPINTTTIIITPSVSPSSCPEFMCFIFCEFGFVKDSNGCNICQCRSDPCKNNTCADKEVCRADDSGYSCIPQCIINNKLAKEKCDLVCQSGYEKDEEGCYICKCKEVNCKGQICPPGFECGEVTRGCENHPCKPVIKQMCIKVEPSD